MEPTFPFPPDPADWQTAYTADNAYYDAEPISSAASLLSAVSLVAILIYGIVFLFALQPVTLHLFDLDAGLAAGLDEGKIADALRAEFKSRGWPLTDQATLAIVQPGREWIVQDGDTQYTIQRRGESLRVKGTRNGVMFVLDNIFLIKKFLFPLRLQSAEALDAGLISEQDREVFASYGKPLGADAMVVVKQAGGQWIILDPGGRYLVQNEQQSLRVYENRTWVTVLVVLGAAFFMAYLALKIANKSAFQRSTEFFREFYAPPEGILPDEIIGYRIGGRIKLPMPFSEWFPSISQFKYILVQNGDFLKKDEWPVWAARTLGGPILLIVFDGSALYLERGNRFSRVVGPGISFLERHETVKYAVDLRNKVKEAAEHDISVWTKDGITVKLKARIAYRIGDPQKLKDTPNLIHPYDPEAVKKAIERHAFRWPDPKKEPEEFTWEDAVWGQVTGVVPGYIGKHFLDDLLIADREKGQILSPTVADDLFKDLNKATQGFGVHVLDFQILSIELPQPVQDHYVQYWEAEKQGHATRMTGLSKAFEIRAKEKAKADAQHDLILTIAGRLQKNKKDFTEALLLSLSEVLDHGLSDPYMRSYIGKEAIETLEKIKKELE
ncbi:MAG: hypothetical protein DCC59_07650 [Chloroflexi bacterium]|nr:MAG: hypothetical protein EDM79_12460 [Chloroflexota bacterium]MCK6567687.1 hypothetical protein [Anaerolineales bacterium]RIK53265.1 MAG: hypothetical protein DCC59_07650 [Chloroflexota bacterium]